MNRNTYIRTLNRRLTISTVDSSLTNLGCLTWIYFPNSDKYLKDASAPRLRGSAAQRWYTT